MSNETYGLVGFLLFVLGLVGLIAVVFVAEGVLVGLATLFCVAVGLGAVILSG